jgi:hypothetical protein
MSKAVKKKSKQLKMSLGKARNILVKMILFDLLKQLNRDICSRCGKQIKSLEELSIDHQKPWLDSKDPRRLFFNLKNVGFSHLSCNSALSRGSITQRKVGPKGTAWCYSCKRFRALSKFFKRADHWNGVAYQCKECAAKHRRKVSSLS